MTNQDAQILLWFTTSTIKYTIVGITKTIITGLILWWFFKYTNANQILYWTILFILAFLGHIFYILIGYAEKP